MSGKPSPFGGQLAGRAGLSATAGLGPGFRIPWGWLYRCGCGSVQRFFESLFGRGGFGGHQRQARRDFHARGEDTYARVLIDIEDAYQGATRNLKLKHTELGSDGRPQLTERSLNVRIPKGVRQGQHIRLAKQGGAGIGEGEAGDLFVVLQIALPRADNDAAKRAYRALESATEFSPRAHLGV